MQGPPSHNSNMNANRLHGRGNITNNNQIFNYTIGAAVSKRSVGWFGTWCAIGLGAIVAVVVGVILRSLSADAEHSINADSSKGLVC